MTHRSLLLAATALGALSLAACNQQPAPAPPPSASLPLTDAAIGPAKAAPSADALPDAPPAPVGRLRNPDDGYGYLNRAYYVDDAFGDAPPDYGFDYQGSEPWVWRSQNRAYRVVERLRGGDRYYYYEPGAETPYLVRDPDYAYGYDGGRLVVVFDSRGRRLDPSFVDQRADFGGRYLYRARELRRAAEQDRRQAVARNNWTERRDALEADRQRQEAQRREDARWRAYDDQHAAQERSRWTDERARRQAEAQRQDRVNQDRAQQDRPGPDRNAQDGRQQTRADQRQPPVVVAGPTAPPPVRQADVDRAQKDAGAAKVQALEAKKQADAAAKAQQQAQKQADFNAGRDAQKRAQDAHNAEVKAQQAAAAQKKAQEQAQAAEKAKQVADQKAKDLARHKQHDADVAKAREAKEAAKAAAAREKEAAKPH